jgi:hypothetical protein
LKDHIWKITQFVICCSKTARRQCTGVPFSNNLIKCHSFIELRRFIELEAQHAVISIFLFIPHIPITGLFCLREVKLLFTLYGADTMTLEKMYYMIMIENTSCPDIYRFLKHLLFYGKLWAVTFHPTRVSEFKQAALAITLCSIVETVWWLQTGC